VTSSLLDVRRGSQTPRVANYPPYPTSAAEEVIDFAEYCGLFLDPWQQFVLKHGLGQRVDGSWTAPKCSCWVPRQNGKGGIIEALELAWLFLFDEDLIIHSAHQHRTAQQAYSRLERIVRRTPDIHRQVRQYRQANGEQGIELYDGRELQYTTRSRTAVRGFSAKKVVLDEAQELTSDQMAAILPTVSAMDNWQVWFFGTPPDAPDAWCYGLKEDGEASAPRLAHFDWGAALDLDKPEDLAKTHDPATWYACNPALGIRITTETVEDEDTPSGLGDKFPQERLGVWKPRAKGGSGVISDDLWKDLADRGGDPERPADLAFAIDVNRARSHTSISAVGPRADGVMVAMLIDYRRGTDWVPARMAELKAKWNPVAIGLDIRSEASTVALELAKLGIKPPADPDRPKRGDLAVPTAGDVATAFGLFVDLANNRGLCHLDEAQLNVALAGAKTRDLAGGRTWDRKGDTDISPLVSVTNAHWAYVTRVELVRSTYDPLMNIF
jgi:hypothetical protein